MDDQAFHIEYVPVLRKPILIAGFEGWGNALDISRAMVLLLIRKLKGVSFAKINPDLFYRYDESRPVAHIEEGLLKGVSPPGGSFYAAHLPSSQTDLVILQANEPNTRWFHFVGELFSLAEKLGVQTLITLGSMYDNVLHSDRIVSGVASSEELLAKLKEKSVNPITYRGPSAIHSTIHWVGKQRGFHCMSLWCHCPYYLQGTTHFGLLSHLGSLLSSLGNFELDTDDLEKSWKELNAQILKLIEKNPELQTMISELRKAKVRGSWASMKGSLKKDDKVIYLEDFLKPT